MLLSCSYVLFSEILFSGLNVHPRKNLRHPRKKMRPYWQCVRIGHASPGGYPPQKTKAALGATNTQSGRR